MSGPSQIVRERREAGARRRLELVRLLREDPSATNLALAKALSVNRNTIALDRRILMEQLTKQSLTETELLRAEMVDKLQTLNEELELHRDGKKLPVSVVHEMLLIHRTMIELLGVRKPVVEKQVQFSKRTYAFETKVVSTTPKYNVYIGPKPKEAPQLEAGDPNEND